MAEKSASLTEATIKTTQTNILTQNEATMKNPDSTDPGLRSERLNYLDNLRSFAMLLGVFVHAATLQNFGAMELLATVSDFFRMAAFFLVSGFFATLLLNKRGALMFYRMRLPAVLLPFFSGFIILNPATLYLVYHHHNHSTASDPSLLEIIVLSAVGKNMLAGPIVWHLHLWFLISLTIFVLTAPAAFWIIQTGKVRLIISYFSKIMPKVLAPVMIAMATGITVVLMRTMYAVLIEQYHDIWLVKITLSYWPFFCLGMVLYQWPRSWEAVHGIDVPTFALAGIAYVCWHFFDDISDSSQIREALRIFAQSVTRCAIIFALLGVFRLLFNRRTGASTLLIESIYTVYIFHFLIIYILARFVIDTSDANVGAFLVISLLTIFAGVLLHHLVINRNWFLRALFNGRI